MSDEFIMRPLTLDEKRTTLDPTENTFKKEFRKRLIKTAQEYTKKSMPFCSRCANFDFVEAVEKYVREKRKRGETVTIRDIDLVDKVVKNLDQYGDTNRFQLDSEVESFDYQVVGHARTKIYEGYYKHFVCKVCGGDKVGKVSVLIQSPGSSVTNFREHKDEEGKQSGKSKK